MQRSIEWAWRCVEFGEQHNVPYATALGYEFLAEDMYMLGRWREALDYAERDRALAEKIGSLDRFAWAEAGRAWALHGLGELKAGLQAVNACLMLAEQTNDRRLAVFARTKRATLEIDLDHERAMQADMDYVLARANEAGRSQYFVWAHNALSYINIQRQDWAALLEQCRQWEAVMESKHVDWYIEAYLGLGRLGETAELFDEAIQIGKLPVDILGQGSIFQQSLAVRYHAARGEWQPAARLFECTIAKLEQSDGKLNLGRTLMQRGLMRRAPGSVAEAASDL